MGNLVVDGNVQQGTIGVVNNDFLIESGIEYLAIH